MMFVADVIVVPFNFISLTVPPNIDTTAGDPYGLV